MRQSWRVVVLFIGLACVSAPTLLAQERILHPPRGGALYSDAVRVGDLVFLSGVVSGGEEPADQFRGIWRRIGRILEEAGSGLEHVVDITTYHVGMHDHIDDFVAVKNEFLPENPTWTAVGVTELYMADAVVEVKVIAAVPDP